MIKFFKNIPYHIRSAGKSLVRHFVMTLSASSAVMVTLILLGAFILLVGNVSKFTDNIEEDIRIHVVMSEDIETQEQIDQVKNAIANVDGVKDIVFSSKEDELNLLINEKGEEFSSYTGEENPLHNAFFVTVSDASNIEGITASILKLSAIDDAVFGGDSMTTLVDMLASVRSGIVIFVALLGMLALFLISNTIKMAIYARSNEIAIMRNVGATNTFIKTPFMMEGMMIGLFGAIIPCILAYFGYEYLFTSMNGQLFTSMFSFQPIFPFVWQVMGILALSGMGVGILGSFISTTRYLHWKR